MRHPKTIGVVTGTRAEYGLLHWLMKAIAADPDLRSTLVIGAYRDDEVRVADISDTAARVRSGGATLT